MKTLKQFYREMQAWIDAGCPEHDVFDRKQGLCVNLASWGGDEWLNLGLERQFVGAGLHRDFPFNNGSSVEFHNEGNSRNYYQNPARLAWIKDHAA